MFCIQTIVEVYELNIFKKEKIIVLILYHFKWALYRIYIYYCSLSISVKASSSC